MFVPLLVTLCLTESTFSMTVSDFASACSSLAAPPLVTTQVNNNQTCLLVNKTRTDSFRWQQMAEHCASIQALPNGQLITPNNDTIPDTLHSNLDVVIAIWLGIQQPDQELSLDSGWLFKSTAFQSTEWNATDVLHTHFAADLDVNEAVAGEEQCMYLIIVTSGTRYFRDAKCDSPPTSINIACEFQLTCAQSPCSSSELCKTTDPFRGHFICERSFQDCQANISALAPITMSDLRAIPSPTFPESQFLRRAVNKKRMTALLSENGVTDQLICCKLCSANLWCKSFSYHAQQQNCELHSEAFNDLLQSESETQGYVIIDKIEL